MKEMVYNQKIFCYEPKAMEVQRFSDVEELVFRCKSGPHYVSLQGAICKEREDGLYDIIIPIFGVDTETGEIVSRGKAYYVSKSKII